MMTILDAQALLVKRFFNFWGRLGGAVLNYGSTRGLDVRCDAPYGTHVEQRLDILAPGARSVGGLPVLIYLHGGGWISADKGIYRGIAATFARLGYLTFNLNYRLAPASRFPAALQDAANAIDWIGRHLECYGGNSTTIVLAGDSAGAQIAAWYACALNKPGLFEQAGIDASIPRLPIAGLMLFYGVYDFYTVMDTGFPFIKTYARSYLGQQPDSYARNAEIASPIRHLSAQYPPVLLCAGERDRLYPQSVAFAGALEQAGVRCRQLLFPRRYRADHGFLFFRWLSASKTVFSAAGDFLHSLDQGQSGMKP
ncbi:MAG: alpha/beta hydrolase [Gammaproteobacteria bacterium]|nr:alpha/beta hydrolase [Gammaproteobacteria bacterium]MCP5415572.1 alpha/beta hydrolase [Chromatiaceae bacterium]